MPWYRNIWLWAFLIGIVSVTAIRPFLRRVPPPPPVIATLPDFRLTDQEGRDFARADLEGRVWVANFFFTRCTSICPLLTRAVDRLSTHFHDKGIEDVAFISISVDPAWDTPERLRDYARTHGIDPGRWKLLTGSPEEVRSLVVGGFLKPIGEPETVDGSLVDIAHSGELALVDPAGGLRGYYGIDDLGLEEIFHRAQHVAEEALP